MREPPWKSLVRHLDDSGYESPYLDRLSARLDAGGIRQSLETEIIRVVAQAQCSTRRRPRPDGAVWPTSRSERSRRASC